MQRDRRNTRCCRSMQWDILFCLMLMKCAEWAPFTVKTISPIYRNVFLCTRHIHTHISYDRVWWWRRYPMISMWTNRTRVCHYCYYVSIDFIPLRNALKCKNPDFGNYGTKNTKQKEPAKTVQIENVSEIKSPEKLMLCNFQHVKPQSDMKAFHFMTKVDAKLSMFDLFIEMLFVLFLPFAAFFIPFLLSFWLLDPTLSATCCSFRARRKCQN